MIINDDCLHTMRNMKANSIDFVVTDPPYGLNFMGKKWDSEVPNYEIWKECLRVCKPGAMLASFGGSRTHHHLMIALEQAGWEIRDVIMWLYGSGFPKSHNHFGLEGYGTSLKPAYEPIIIAMKPLDGTYKQNVEKWGIGGINIDDSRIESEDQEKLSKNWDRKTVTDIRSGNYGNGISSGIKLNTKAPSGRWPANLIFDEEAAEILDQNSGVLKSGSGNRRPNGGGKMFNGFSPMEANFQCSVGGASRFFYCAKASPKERNKGCEEMDLKECGIKNDSGKGYSESDPYKKIIIQNNHPTVKPISLMKYIITLLAPPNNPTLLDPFVGSGSTLIAAAELGINAIGIEKNSEYFQIAKNRIIAYEL